jgi:vacuolar protein sorting-associated protein 13A/C
MTEAFKASLRDQAYDKFNLCMENMQMLVAMPNENWRCELDKNASPLFLLKPTTVQVGVQFCLVKNDPELPLVKITGKLDNISVNISDYRYEFELLYNTDFQ